VRKFLTCNIFCTNNCLAKGYCVLVGADYSRLFLVLKVANRDKNWTNFIRLLELANKLAGKTGAAVGACWPAVASARCCVPRVSLDRLQGRAGWVAAGWPR